MRFNLDYFASTNSHIAESEDQIYILVRDFFSGWVFITIVVDAANDDIHIYKDGQPQTVEVYNNDRTRYEDLADLDVTLGGTEGSAIRIDKKYVYRI